MDELRKLYDAVSQRFNVGTYDEFSSKMQTSDDRKRFYDAISSKGVSLGDYDTYEQRLGGSPRKEEQPVQQTEDFSDTEQPETLNVPEPTPEEEPKENPISLWRDLGYALKQGFAHLGAGAAGIPNAVNKAIVTALLPEEELAKLNEMDPEMRENVMATLTMGTHPAQGSVKGSIDLQNDLSDKANELSEKMIQFEGNIVDDLAKGNYSQGLYRTLRGMVQSAPSLVAAAAPGGLAVLGVATGSQKLEDLEREGEDLGWKTMLNAGVNGTAEAFFERYTAGILKGLGQVVKGNAKLATKYANDWVSTLVKDGLIEGGSEAATELVQQLSDKLTKGEEVDGYQLLKDMGDAFIVGKAMGVGIGGTKVLAGHVIKRAASKQEKQEIEKLTEKRNELESIRTEENAEAVDEQIEEVDLQFKEFRNTLIQKFDGLEYEDKEKVIETDKKIERTESLLKEDISPETKSDLENQVKDLETEKRNILFKDEVEKTTETPVQEDVNEEIPKESEQEAGDVVENVEKDENKPGEDTVPDGEAGPDAVQNTEEGQGKDVQSPVEPGPSETTTEPVEKEITLGGKRPSTYKTTFKDGVLTVTDSKGKTPSSTTVRKVQNQYAEEFDFTQGERITEEEAVNTEYHKTVAEKSNNPSEVAEALSLVDTESFVDDNVGYKSKVIADNIGHVSRQQFIDFGDENNIANSIGRAYLRKDGRKIDTLAQELSEMYDLEITPQDIIDFIMENPQGPREVRDRVKSEHIKPLKERFTKLTGLPATDKYLAMAIEAQNKKENDSHVLDHLNDQEILTLQNERSQFEKETYGTEAIAKSDNEAKHPEGNEGGSGVQTKGNRPGRKQKTQKERVKEVVKEGPKSIQEVAEKTGILEPNVRRILGVGAKDGTFERVDKGVYVLKTKDGKQTAWIEAGEAQESLDKMAKEGRKFDMVFLDPAYFSQALIGRNRKGISKYDFIQAPEFAKVMKSVSKLVDNDNHVYVMLSGAPSAQTDMEKYVDGVVDSGFKLIGEGGYTKLYQSGKPVLNVRGKEAAPERIMLFTKSGNAKEGEIPVELNFRFVRPSVKKSYQTEKPKELLRALIKQSTLEGEEVLDPFAGSGVTGEQAIETGRSATLVEKSEKVVEEKIKPRVEKAIEKKDAEDSNELSDTKIKRNGKPIVVYRTQKDNRKQGVQRRSGMTGIYFSENKESTKIYGDKTSEYHLNITNPIILKDTDWNLSVMPKYVMDDLIRQGYNGAVWLRKGEMYEIIAFDEKQVIPIEKKDAEAPKKDYSKPETYKDDLDLETTRRSYSGYSFSPERRGDAEVKEWGEIMSENYKELRDLAKEKGFPLEELNKEFERYHARLLKLKKEMIGSRSNVLSTMITGPANFNVRRNQKSMNSYENKLNKYLEVAEKGFKAIRKKIAPTYRRIISGDKNAIEQLEAKLKGLERLKELEDRFNKELHRKKAGQDDRKLFFMENDVVAAFKEAFPDRHTDFVKSDIAKAITGSKLVTNMYLTRNISEVKKRIEAEKRLSERIGDPDAKVEFDGGHYEKNVEANRIQIFFNDKPDAETRSMLKKNAFKWSPKNQAWQRQMTVNAIRATEKLFPAKDPNAKDDKISGEDRSIILTLLTNAEENLDKADKYITQVSKENLNSAITGISLAAAKTVIKAMKVAVKTAKTITEVVEAGLKALRETEWYKNLSENDQFVAETELREYVIGPVAETVEEAKTSMQKLVNQANGVIKRMKSRNQNLSEMRTWLKNYIRKAIKAEDIGELQKQELNAILASLNNAKSEKSLKRAVSKINDIAHDTNSRKILKKINDLLKKDFTKVVSGRVKANLTDQNIAEVLTGVRDIVNQFQENRKQKNLSAPFKPTGEDVQFIERLQKEVDESTGQSDNLGVSKQIALDLLNAMVSNNSDQKNRMINFIYKELSSIYETGRSILMAQIQARNERDANLVDALEEDANPEGKMTNKTVEQLVEDEKKIQNFINRVMFSSFSGAVSGSMDSMATIISKKGGEGRDSSPWVQLVNRLKGRETLKKTRIKEHSRKLRDLQKSLFGSVTKADKALMQTTKLEIVKKVDGADANTPLFREEILFTHSQLLNVWMNSHNEELLPGLASAGFTAETLEQIDKILPDNLKRLGEGLFELYEESHAEVNEVYREMNFHDLGKSKFYAGKVYREGYEHQEDTENLLNIVKIGTANYGSLKERINNDKPIVAMDVTTLFLRNLQESSHYVAYADVFRQFNKVLSSNKIKKAILLNNPKVGDKLLQALAYYRTNDLEQGGEKGLRTLDRLGRNLAVSVLALKTKIGLTQTISAINGAFEMPKGISTNEFLTHFNPLKIVSTSLYLINNSEYLKNRYDLSGLENTVLGLSDIAKRSELSVGNPSVNARRKQIARFYKRVLNIAMMNVRVGDAVGVLGSAPVYSSWKAKLIREGMSKEMAEKKAMAKFEAAVDRAQQTTSTFGKSKWQKHPVLRYFMMFATSPIQNQQNALYHGRELLRSFKGKQYKGSNVRNALAFLNYQFAQPMLYTYIANIMVGSITRALGWSDEEPNDKDMALLSSMMIGNAGSIPIIGGILQFTIDRFVLEREHSFGGILNNHVYEEVKEIEDAIVKASEAKSEERAWKYTKEAISKTTMILTAFPDFALDVMSDWNEVYWTDDYTLEERMQHGLGYSKWNIDDNKDASGKKKKKVRKKKERKEKPKRKK